MLKIGLSERKIKIVYIVSSVCIKLATLALNFLPPPLPTQRQPCQRRHSETDRQTARVARESVSQKSTLSQLTSQTYSV